MRISKLLSAACAATCLSGFFTVRAQDNPAQAAARAALMEKISELNAQPSPPANQRMAQAIIVTPTGTSVVQSTPASAAPDTLLGPADTPDTPAQAAARAALAEKISQLNAQPSTSANQTPVAATASSSPFSPVPPPSNPKVQISPPPAVPPTAPAVNPQPAAAPMPKAATAPVAATAVKTPPPANGNYPGKSLGLPPFVAPPPPVSAQQDAELQALLAKYMANQVSPDEYQKERAAILAKP